jgi:hypothetical protein
MIEVGIVLLMQLLFVYEVLMAGTQQLFDMRSDPGERISILNATSAPTSPTTQNVGSVRTAVRMGHQKISRITMMQDSEPDAFQRLNARNVVRVAEALKLSAEQFVRHVRVVLRFKISFSLFIDAQGNKAHASHKDLRLCHYELSDASNRLDWSNSLPSAPQL